MVDICIQNRNWRFEKKPFLFFVSLIRQTGVSWIKKPSSPVNLKRVDFTVYHSNEKIAFSLSTSLNSVTVPSLFFLSDSQASIHQCSSWYEKTFIAIDGYSASLARCSYTSRTKASSEVLKSSLSFPPSPPPLSLSLSWIAVLQELEDRKPEESDTGGRMMGWVGAKRASERGGGTGDDKAKEEGRNEQRTQRERSEKKRGVGGGPRKQDCL